MRKYALLKKSDNFFKIIKLKFSKSGSLQSLVYIAKKHLNRRYLKNGARYCVIYQTEFYGELKQLTRKWSHWKIAWNNNLKCW